ncbi:MAG TPA: gamma-glutamyl-gamma-aminobutyrate hydrolase family protein [Bryobacteraceae bacterium]|nr:gamma-glutamyl-gamma-aminobutyrate hydrolase family protein [Bryobacteraceae bacterium]
MRVFVFRHSPLEHLGRIGEVLEAHRLEYDYIDLYRTRVEHSSATDAGAFIFLGGSMSANDPLPFIKREIELVREAVAASKPVLGVCLGAQLIARALGARVYQNSVKEIGWAPVTFDDAAHGDVLFSGVHGSKVIFHWHGETFDLPSGAECLASSAACRNQAFRWGDRTYGLQFHLEVTPEMIAEWCAEDGRCGDKREATWPIDPHAHADSMRNLALQVFGRWCELVKQTSSECEAAC